MKKVVSVVLAVLMLASLSAFAFADVNPSVETKAAPEVKSSEVFGTDAAITIEETVASDEIPADASDELKAELEEKIAQVKDLIEALKDQSYLNAAVNGAVTVETNRTVVENDKAADAVYSVSDVFYVDAKDEEGKSVLAHTYVEGETPEVQVLVKVDLPENLVKVLQLVGDVWVEVPVVVDANGDPCLEISYAGPVVFVYNSNVEKG